MIKFCNLILNEIIKVFSKVSTWIMALILVVGILLSGFVLKASNETIPLSNWKNILTAENDYNIAQLENTQLPRFVRMQVEQEILINTYRLGENIPPEQTKSLWNFMNSMKNMITLITVFTVILGASIVSREYSTGTIKLLLINHNSRWKVLISKYITVFIFSLILLTVLVLLSLIWGGLLFGFSDLSLKHLIVSNGRVLQNNTITYILKEYGLASITLLMIGTLSFMLSTAFKASTFSVGISIFIMMIGKAITDVLRDYSWTKYTIFANLDLQQYFIGRPIIDGMTLSFSIGILSLYFILFNVSSWFIFCRRDILS